MLTKAMQTMLTKALRESGDFQSSQIRVVPSQLMKIIFTSQRWTIPTLNHPTSIQLTTISRYSMETCTVTPDSWSPTPIQPSLVFSATTLNALKTIIPTEATDYENDTTTQAAEPALDVEAALSAAKHVFVTKNKKNQSTQTN